MSPQSKKISGAELCQQLILPRSFQKRGQDTLILACVVHQTSRKIYENCFPITHTTYPTWPEHKVGRATHSIADAMSSSKAGPRWAGLNALAYNLEEGQGKGERRVPTKYIFSSFNKIIWTLSISKDKNSISKLDKYPDSHPFYYVVIWKLETIFQIFSSWWLSQKLNCLSLFTHKDCFTLSTQKTVL